MFHAKYYSESKIKQAYHNVVGGEYRFSTGVFGKWAATLTLEERTSRSNIDILDFGSAVNLAEVQQRSSLSILRVFVLFTHLA